MVLAILLVVISIQDASEYLSCYFISDDFLKLLVLSLPMKLFAMLETSFQLGFIMGWAN